MCWLHQSPHVSFWWIPSASLTCLVRVGVCVCVYSREERQEQGVMDVHAIANLGLAQMALGHFTLAIDSFSVLPPPLHALPLVGVCMSKRHICTQVVPRLSVDLWQPMQYCSQSHRRQRIDRQQ